MSSDEAATKSSGSFGDWANRELAGHSGVAGHSPQLEATPSQVRPSASQTSSVSRVQISEVKQQAPTAGQSSQPAFGPSQVPPAMVQLSGRSSKHSPVPRQQPPVSWAQGGSRSSQAVSTVKARPGALQF